MNIYFAPLLRRYCISGLANNYLPEKRLHLKGYLKRGHDKCHGHTPFFDVIFAINC
jgi:hypothetical protein